MSFDDVWKKYYPRLFVFLRSSFSLSREDAEDIVQETLLKVYKNRSAYSSGYAFSTWVYSIGRNACIDFLRKKQRMPALAAMGADGFEYADPRQREPAEILIRNEEGNDVSAFIGTLGEDDRQLVYLKMYEDLPYREISVITGKPAGTLKYRFWEIRKNLRNHMGRLYA